MKEEIYKTPQVKCLICDKARRCDLCAASTMLEDIDYEDTEMIL